MADIKKFKKTLSDHMDMMTNSNTQLFQTGVDPDTLWDTYLDSFPAGTNEIFRKRREYDCSNCRHFIRPFGNIVTVKNGVLTSIWDLADLEYPFDIVAKELSKLVKSKKIIKPFVYKLKKMGVNSNHELTEDGKALTWEHFYYELPKAHMCVSSDTIGSIEGKYAQNVQVFKRGVSELKLDAVETVMDLINQKSLYKGDEFKPAIRDFINAKQRYDKIDVKKQDDWCWENAFKSANARIRNSAIGTLLVNVSDGMDLDVAVRKYEAIVAPSNYKRPKAIYTKKMIEAAEQQLTELGLVDSLSRRHAVIGDITVNNVLFVDRDVKENMKKSVFDDLKATIPVNTKKLDKIEEIGIDDFIANVLPTASNIELMVENKHSDKLVSLIAPQNADTKSMFKWNNNFSWAYNGDITDSMKENVKKAGGKVDGVLRFSIQWNDQHQNTNDLDAHCVEPCGNHISFNSKRNRITGGNLDIDITAPGSKLAVENITWPLKDRMKEGTYRFFVNNYSGSTGRDFTAELEYDGEIYSFEYNGKFRRQQDIDVITIDFSKTEGITVKSSMPSNISSKSMWGINTNQFVKVQTCMLSPNYWDEQQGVGNKHYFFMLENCINNDQPRGFFNEFLNNELNTHKKVFEALGSKMKVAESDEQLSGLGFSTTQRSSIVAKVSGNFTRMIKINF